MLLVRSASSVVKTSTTARDFYVQFWKYSCLRSTVPCLAASKYTNYPVHPQNIRKFSGCSRRYESQPPETLDLLETYKSSFSFPPSTQEIKSLSEKHIGKQVCLHGYLGSRSDVSKKLSFVPLLSKDLRYSVQIISVGVKDSTGNIPQSHGQIRSLTQHTPVAVRGTIKAREPSKTETLGEAKKINDVELELSEICPLNDFPKDLMMTEDTNFISGERHLQLRTTKALRDALKFRSDAADICRERLRSQEFVEIETPLLFKSTPEGAREFLVPTREKGMAYALPQSPQQYKQILMASGIPNYFQIARCFRDEDLRADRQPEFTQLDLEMSFAKGEQVMQCMEGLIKRLWKDMLSIDLSSPFARVTYQDAMAQYGSDKPDLRIDMKLHSIGELLPADLVSKIGPHTNPAVDIMKLHIDDNPSMTRNFVNEFMASPEAAPFLSNPDGQPGIFIYDPRQPLEGLQTFGFQTAEYIEETLALEEGDLIVLQARKKGPFTGGFTPMGRLRLALHKAAVAKGYIPPPTGYNFLWITNFPLFTPSNDTDPGQGGSAGLSSTHHPFTSPLTPHDIDLLPTDPLSVIADHYDIVCNGVELGGGSRRIHSAQVQEYVLRDVLKMPEERIGDFRHLLDVLKAGCPPHAGIALGFDRLIAVMLGKESVRDVIAFPKSGKGEDMLVRSPNRMTEGQLKTYYLKLVD
ncbi:hypothetical protein EJ08DRAFT_728690 [Tothia fuscella]|uniref:Aminoacyl-transfer RNA synthetases class-II family profile domain-containing protein n=1 Tax=Tothia fuscella TaxID=1048955 RepID=A0A9P4P2D0_9PEZI|nr:hypothetical protein EJ08DRAFT_728690 [Tothia fuscella]